jgi:hypothetical protein
MIMVSPNHEGTRFSRTKTSGPRTSLQSVENRWQDGRPRQRVLATLGRLDQLQQTGQLDALLVSGARLAQSLLLLSAHAQGHLPTITTRRIGPTLIFERLWQQSGCQDVLEQLLDGRRFEFDVERAIFLTVLHRLFNPGSDRAADKGRTDYQSDGGDALQLHHLYRAMAWLGAPLPPHQQAGQTPFAPRGIKDRIEEGYRRYLSGSDSPPFQIDEAKIAAEARSDGTWVLRTHTDLDAAEGALQFKRLWRVEPWFRSCKSLLQTRPIFPKCDETIRGHVFCSFLALVLRQELQARLEERGHELEWADVIGDLDRLQMVEVEQDGKKFRLRSEVQGSCGKVFQAVGVALPPTVQQASPTSPGEDAPPSATPPD